MIGFIIIVIRLKALWLSFLPSVKYWAGGVKRPAAGEETQGKPLDELQRLQAFNDELQAYNRRFAD
jgi:hypothetical protein